MPTQGMRKRRKTPSTISASAIPIMDRRYPFGSPVNRAGLRTLARSQRSALRQRDVDARDGKRRARVALHAPLSDHERQLALASRHRSADAEAALLRRGRASAGPAMHAL